MLGLTRTRGALALGAGIAEATAVVAALELAAALALVAGFVPAVPSGATSDLASIHPGETLPIPEGNSTNTQSVPSVAKRVTGRSFDKLATDWVVASGSS